MDEWIITVAADYKSGLRHHFYPPEPHCIKTIEFAETGQGQDNTIVILQKHPDVKEIRPGRRNLQIRQQDVNRGGTSIYLLPQ